MNLSVGQLYRAVFGLAAREKDFSHRRFRGGTDRTHARIEQIIGAFIGGYNQALLTSEPVELTRHLDGGEAELRGFAYEAAAMALGLLDLLTPWQRQRWALFVHGSAVREQGYRGLAGRHRYMAYIGYGLALARLKRPVAPALAHFDPELGWLTMDGYGFHQGFFDFERYVDRQQLPEGFSGYTRRGFDQGLGRSLWFTEGADPDRIPRVIAAFPQERQPDLWSGVGLACAYAGGVEAQAIRLLQTASATHAPHFAQGIAFAALTRVEAGNLAGQTELACRTVWGSAAPAVAEWAQAAMADFPADAPHGDRYEITRGRLRLQFAQEVRV